MANELYLHTLQQLRDGCKAEHMDTETAALDVAIQALSADGDCISRQAAIDAVIKRYDEYGRTAKCEELASAIKKLPSAQPEQQWIPCSEPPQKDGTYIVYAPDYMGGSSSAKECHNGVMFSKYKKGKWSIEHGYYSRPNCVKAWKPIELWRGEEHG